MDVRYCRGVLLTYPFIYGRVTSYFSKAVYDLIRRDHESAGARDGPVTAIASSIPSRATQVRIPASYTWITFQKVPWPNRRVDKTRFDTRALAKPRVECEGIECHHRRKAVEIAPSRI
jgi:hypothetical protein